MLGLSDSAAIESTWLYRFLDSVSQIPGPRWLNFLLVPVTLFVLAHAGVYLLDPSKAWAVESEIAIILFWLAFGLVAYSDIIDSTHGALNEFRSSLQIDDEEFRRIYDRFIALPRAWGWLIVPAMAFAFLFVSFRPPIPGPPELSAVFRTIMILLGTATFTVLFHLIVKVIYILKMINQLYASVGKINIFNLQDLYALSALSARIGIIFIIAGTLSYIINVLIPGGDPQIQVAVFFITLNIVMAILLFLLPLLGIHRELAKVKQRVARENNRVLNTTLRKLHERSERSQLDEMPLIQSQAGALMQFRREIDQISTWPWKPQTLRGFITAISLPIVIWLIQQFLGQIIGA